MKLKYGESVNMRPILKAVQSLESTVLKLMSVKKPKICLISIISIKEQLKISYGFKKNSNPETNQPTNQANKQTFNQTADE